MTSALRSTRIAATLAALFGLAAGCARTPAGPGGSPGAEAGAEQGGVEQAGEAGKGGDDEDAYVAVVSDGTLEPDPEQLDAGVPYLRFRVEVGDSPARGPATAPVTIVMFSDFECAFCDEAFHTIEELQAEYPEQIRFVYKALPLARHQNALEAALVGHSARAQGKFWEFHDLVFSGEGIDPETIESHARALGLDYDRITDELETLEYAPEVRRDMRVAKRLQLTSTPVFFINGRMLPGARPKRIFRHMIDQELDLAARLAEDKSIEASELYDYATRWGYTAIVYEDAPPELDEDTVYPVPIGDSPTRGPADAPITIVAFSDFQCPFCARGHATMEELRDQYGEKIRFVFKHFPLPGHPLGALASRGSFAAASVGKFWEFHDAVFELGPRYQPEDLITILERLGVPHDRIEAALTTGVHDAEIEEDLDLGVRLRVSGTPAYFVNGRPIVGAHPLMDFRMLIAEELERVEEARGKGVLGAEMYEHLTGAGE